MKDTVTVKRVSVDMVDEVFVNTLGNIFPADEDNPKWDISKTQNFVENTNNIFLVGYLDGNIAGYLYGHILDRFDKEKHFLIYELFTNKKYRRNGVAKKLIAHLLELLKEENFDEVWVLTNKSNKPATALYAETGAKPENEDDCMFIYKLKEPK